MTSGAKGVAQLGVGLAVLTETKLTDDHYTCLGVKFQDSCIKSDEPQSGGDCSVVERELYGI